MPKYIFLYLVTLSFCFISHAQQITGAELLDKAIAYHDPNNNWQTFKGNFIITMNAPNAKERRSALTMDFPKEYFSLVTKKGGTTSTQILHKNHCKLSLNGSSTISKEDEKKHHLTCTRVKKMKNYYTYLYGLPMKLKDPGTKIDPQVHQKSFKGKAYLVLKVKYDPKTGKDTWYFYFNPKTYRMEAYQFFHDEAKNDGEYILLTGEETISGITMPKTRAWYYNTDNTYLGTDILSKPQ